MIWTRCWIFSSRWILSLPSPLLPLSFPRMKHAGLLFCFSSQHPQSDLSCHPSTRDLTEGPASAAAHTLILLGSHLTFTAFWLQEMHYFHPAAQNYYYYFFFLLHSAVAEMDSYKVRAG